MKLQLFLRIEHSLFSGFVLRMIGVFDSGLGGLLSLNYFKKTLPKQNFLYLGDTKYLPYGQKTGKFLEKRTHSCLNWLFNQGCSLVIVACNTAAAYGIKSWQKKYPQRKALSITTPGVEKVIEIGSINPFILATTATCKKKVYTNMLLQKNSLITPMEVSGKQLVDYIENPTPSGIDPLLKTLFESVPSSYDSIVLGCSHYPLVVDQIKKYSLSVPIINPSFEASVKILSYKKRHPQYFWGEDAIITYVETGSLYTDLTNISSVFADEAASFSSVSIDE